MRTSTTVTRKGGGIVYGSEMVSDLSDAITILATPDRYVRRKKTGAIDFILGPKCLGSKDELDWYVTLRTLRYNPKVILGNQKVQVAIQNFASCAEFDMRKRRILESVNAS